MKANSNTRIRAIGFSILFWIVFILSLVGSGFLSSATPPSLARLFYGIFGTIGAAVVTWAFVKYEKSTFQQIGLALEKGTFLRFIKGLAIGFVIIIPVIAALIFWGDLHIYKNKSAAISSTLLGCLTLLPLALMEEVGFRGHPFIKLNNAFGLRATQIIVALAFGIYHVINGWSIYVAFTGPFVWAFVFGLSAAWSRGIAMPTGIHLALNIGQLLSGVNNNPNSIWKLDYNHGATPAAMTHTAHVGLALQMIVLIVAVIVTEYYIRKKRILTS